MSLSYQVFHYTMLLLCTFCRHRGLAKENHGKENPTDIAEQLQLSIVKCKHQMTRSIGIMSALQMVHLDPECEQILTNLRSNIGEMRTKMDAIFQ